MNTTTNSPIVHSQHAKVPVMAAIVQHAYGSADVLTLEPADRPEVGDDDVLVRVHAASINHADWVYATGRPLISRLAFGLRKPRASVRGKDVAGTVETVGKNVRRFRRGDEVYSEVDAGGFAEYVAVRSNLVALKPANLTFEQAASVPLAARTALQALRDGGNLQSGQKVLVNGASGGVGTFAVQIAKAFGAEVTGVCSTRNAELVRSLGAAEIIDYTREDFTTIGQRYDVILDLIGNHSLTGLRHALTLNGTLVLSSGTGGRVFGPMGRIARALLLSPFVSQNLRIFSAARSTEVLDELRGLIELGDVAPAVDRTYPLSETAQAMRYFAEEHARGKVVITIHKRTN